MTFLEAIILGLVQGLTEFLPVSSSGHLVIFQKLLGLHKVPLSFDILLHVATLGAVLIFFRKILLKRIIHPSLVAIKEKNVKKVPQLVWLLGIGTIPAVFVGLFLKDYIETLFSSLGAVGIGLGVTTMWLFLTLRFNKNKKSAMDVTWQDALIVGCFQALAIFPGISRSGSTVMSGLARGMKRETAFNFSFLLSIPAILGAMLLDIGDLFKIPFNQFFVYMAGAVMAFTSGYYALVIFKKIMVKNNLAWFGWYTLALVLLIVLLV